MSDKKSGLSIILVISLCVNAALIGAVGAGLYSLGSERHRSFERDHRAHDSRHAPGPFEERLARSAFENLSGEDKQKFQRDLAREWQESHQERKSMFEARLRLFDILAADNIDKKAAEEVFADIRAGEQEMRQRLQGRVLSFFDSMPAEKRRALLSRSDDRSERIDEFRQKLEDRRGGNPPPRFGDGTPPTRD